jgi:hypothetical protein
MSWEKELRVDVMIRCLRLFTIGALGMLALGTVSTMPQQGTPAAGAGGAQEPAAVFRGGVEMMNLSVTVTDKRGRSVTDLTKDDFVVLEDEKPHEISVGVKRRDVAVRYRRVYVAD